MSEKGNHTSRKDYQKGVLMESAISGNPFTLMHTWLDEAEALDPEHYNAFSLTTVGEKGYPHSRIVLLRKFDEHGLVFYTNYNSNKGKELSTNSKVCLNFFWKENERQVRIYGEARRVNGEECDAYFATRPRESQIGAWASPQSDIIPDRDFLDKKVEEITEKYKGKDIPRPDYWGGIRIIPHHFEFWQGRSNRLHDRLVFRVDADFSWYHVRLAP